MVQELQGDLRSLAYKVFLNGRSMVDLVLLQPSSDPWQNHGVKPDCTGAYPQKMVSELCVRKFLESPIHFLKTTAIKWQ